MEEKVEGKKQVKLSISNILLIIAIIVIAVMSCYIYTLKTNYNAEVTGLESNVTTMQTTINNLQRKLNMILEIVNSENVSNLSIVNSNEVSGDKDTTNLENDDNQSANTDTSNQENYDNQSANTDTSNQENDVMYTFTSADKAAAQGYPKILKIFGLNENEMEFDYNSGFDFAKSTIDRQITGTAKINAEQMYEYEETVDGHQYKLVFEFDETDTTITIHEYDNGNLFGWVDVVR